MSLLSWLLKPTRKMAEPHTPRVRIGKYTITSHAQNRIADRTRGLKKIDMLENLFGITSKNSKPYTHSDGSLQYDRVNRINRTVTFITNEQNRVKSIRRFHRDKRGRGGAYRHFEKEK